MTGNSIRSRAPRASSAAVRRAMQAVRRRDTNPERLLRTALHRAGFRFRNDRQPEPTLRCKADLLFSKRRVCIFVDGCFWHGCRRHFGTPRTNSAWWTEKIAATVRRDALQARRLKARGWRVIRVWEHALTSSQIERTVARLSRLLRMPGGPRSQHPLP